MASLMAGQRYGDEVLSTELSTLLAGPNSSIDVDKLNASSSSLLGGEEIDDGGGFSAVEETGPNVDPEKAVGLLQLGLVFVLM